LVYLDYILAKDEKKQKNKHCLNLFLDKYNASYSISQIVCSRIMTRESSFVRV